MTDSHPWLKLPPRIRSKLDAMSWDASGLWYAMEMWSADTGGTALIPKSKLPVVTARRLSPSRISAAVAELVDEHFVEDRVDALELTVWEQPPIEVWQDPVQRQRWARDKRLKRDTELCNRIKDRDRHLCRYCGQRVNWADKKSRIAGTYDHVDPDGDNAFDNVVVACKGCNSRKKDRTPQQAGMPLLRPGHARTDAASAADAPVPEPRAGSDPDPIQIRSRSGPGSARAPARDRTEPDPIQTGSRSDPRPPVGSIGRASLQPGPVGPFDDPPEDEGVQ
jgi:5-methylcytosine-specific restriction endonuclease McrA